MAFSEPPVEPSRRGMLLAYGPPMLAEDISLMQKESLYAKMAVCAGAHCHSAVGS
jgi:hypothetical protein